MASFVPKKNKPFNRSFEEQAPPAVQNNAMFYQSGVPFSFHNGVAYFAPPPPGHTTPGSLAPTADPAVYQASYAAQAVATAPTPTAPYPMIYPCAGQPIYLPQQYQYQPMPYDSCFQPVNQASQYIYTTNVSNSTPPIGGCPANQGSPLVGSSAPNTPPASNVHLAPASMSAQYYTTPVNPTEIYYSPLGGLTTQTYSVVSNEGVMYDTPPQTDISSSNYSAEDSCSSSSNSDKARNDANQSLDAESGGAMVPSRPNPPTPVVSLLKLSSSEENTITPEDGEGSIRNGNKQGPSPSYSPLQAFYQQVPPPPRMSHAYLSYPQMPNPSLGPPVFMSSPNIPPLMQHATQPNSYTPPYAPRFSNVRPMFRRPPPPLNLSVPPFPDKFYQIHNNNNSYLASNQNACTPGPDVQLPGGQRRFYNGRGFQGESHNPGQAPRFPRGGGNIRFPQPVPRAQWRRNSFSNSSQAQRKMGNPNPGQCESAPTQLSYPMSHNPPTTDPRNCSSPSTQAQYYQGYQSSVTPMLYYQPANGNQPLLQQAAPQPRKFVNQPKKYGRKHSRSAAQPVQSLGGRISRKGDERGAGDASKTGPDEGLHEACEQVESLAL